MKFSDTMTARIYSDRSVNSSWIQWCQNVLSPQGKDVVDIGCGGGIYSGGLLQCGAKSVIGIDSSEQYIIEARSACPGASFAVGECHDTGLASKCEDIVFERALVHHLTPDEMAGNANEMRRLLRKGGIALVQDRTQEDVAAEDYSFWIRRELMSMFPRLIEFEAKRRPATNMYACILNKAGFADVQISTYAETRKVYAHKKELAGELRSRKGKSILFELTDDELERYVDRILTLCPESDIVECDRWTIWKAK